MSICVFEFCENNDGDDGFECEVTHRVYVNEDHVVVEEGEDSWYSMLNVAEEYLISLGIDADNLNGGSYNLDDLELSNDMIENIANNKVVMVEIM